MSVLVFVESKNNKIKKTSIEAAYYAAQVAKQLNTSAEAIADASLDQEQLSSLGKYGIQKVHAIAHQNLNHFDAKAYTYVVTEAAKKLNASVIVLAHTITGKAIAPMISVKLNAGLVAGATSYPELSNGFVIASSAFSGKAIAHYNIKTETKIIAIAPNTFQPVENAVNCVIEPLEINIPENVFTTKVIDTITQSDKIPLSEATLVVSGGRGLKGPENWGMIEEMANILGAATACSRAVADVHWRPHYEHVGQTGLAIKPNLYIAIGISGAIQHLAGVNQSKTIVVINTDKEAPFFKAADYGIIGDAFEVVPKLNEALKKFKNNAH